MAWPLALLVADQESLSAALLNYFLLSGFIPSSFPASHFSVSIPSPLDSLRRSPKEPCAFLCTNSKTSRHRTRDRDKTCLPGLPSTRSLSEHGYPKSKERGCQAPLPRSTPVHRSSRLTLLYLGVLPISPVSRIPSLILALEESEQLVISNPDAGSQTILTLRSQAPAPPPGDCFLPSLPETSTDQGRARPVPPPSASLSTQTRSAPPIRQVSPVALTAPSRPLVRAALGRSGAFALPETQPGSPHLQAEPGLSKSTMSLPQRPDGDTRPPPPNDPETRTER